MAQLLVRNVDEITVKRLRRRAAEHGVSSEEEHRRLLRDALRPPAKKRKPSLIEFLLNEGPPWPDDFELRRAKDTNEHRVPKF
ncbi:MAG: hypothetical protein K1X78_13485 [Verrucomicrobiaceae bacterium]|nr:hypothetical protein [Verrucomicrobiaceae bacterium]